MSRFVTILANALPGSFICYLVFGILVFPLGFTLNQIGEHTSPPDWFPPASSPYHKAIVQGIWFWITVWLALRAAAGTALQGVPAQSRPRRTRLWYLSM